MFDRLKSLFRRRPAAAAAPADSIAGFLRRHGIGTTNYDLYETALTHGSFTSGPHDSNERLEFVGDAVLGAIIADILYREFPGKNEGRLSKMRSKLVSREALNELGTLHGIPAFLKHRIGKADFSSANNYIGNAFEALIGAIYLDKGYDFTYRYVREHVVSSFADLEALDQEIRDFKSYIIIWAQKHRKDFEFRVDRQPEDDEDTRFCARLFIDGREVSMGVGRNKKIAQQRAAEQAVRELELED